MNRGPCKLLERKKNRLHKKDQETEWHQLLSSNPGNNALKLLNYKNRTQIIKCMQFQKNLPNMFLRKRLEYIHCKPKQSKTWLINQDSWAGGKENSTQQRPKKTQDDGKGKSQGKSLAEDLGDKQSDWSRKMKNFFEKNTYICIHTFHSTTLD